MQENGTTILFVSHDPSAIRALCNHAILLNQGQKIAEGSPSDVLNRYQKIIMARQQAFEANPCFLLTDHIPMPKKIFPSLERMGAKKLTLGSTMLFASQCVVLIHHALDQPAGLSSRGPSASGP